jgi:hypothetical protein
MRVKRQRLIEQKQPFIRLLGREVGYEFERTPLQATLDLVLGPVAAVAEPQLEEHLGEVLVPLVVARELAVADLPGEVATDGVKLRDQLVAVAGADQRERVRHRGLEHGFVSPQTQRGCRDEAIVCSQDQRLDRLGERRVHEAWHVTSSVVAPRAGLP